MDGLKGWHRRGDAGFQLFENEAGDGHGTLTIIAADLEKERERLQEAGFEPVKSKGGDHASIPRLSDPDGNTEVLAEPG